MKGKITGLSREYVFGLSIITMFFGLFLLIMGVLWYWFREIVENNDILAFISTVEEWNAYLLIAGFIIFAIGFYYLYNFLKNKKFVVEELRTNKRSELLKKHNELRSIVKHLPSKYQKMLEEKEDELNIK